MATFIRSVRAGGIPGYLRGALAKLGVKSSDLKHLRAGVADRTVSSATGPVLIFPLQDPGGTADMRRLTGELTAFALRARQHGR